MDATVVMQLWKGVQAGNVGSIKEFRKFVAANDLMLYGQTVPLRPAKLEKPAKVGKKEAALVQAQEPDTSTPLGRLMAQRQGSLN